MPPLRRPLSPTALHIMAAIAEGPGTATPSSRRSKPAAAAPSASGRAPSTRPSSASSTRNWSTRRRVRPSRSTARRLNAVLRAHRTRTPGTTGRSRAVAEIRRLRQEPAGTRMTWLYMVLLRVYPRWFRDRYGAELVAAFEADRARALQAGRQGAFRFWIWILRDLIVSAFRTHRQRRRRRKTRQEGGGAMEALVRDCRHAARQLWARPDSLPWRCCRWHSGSAATPSSSGSWTASSCARSPIRTSIAWSRSA